MKLPEIDNRKKILLLALLCAGVLLLVLFSRPKGKDDAALEEAVVTTPIPEADLPEEDGSKTGSYRRGIREHWDALAEGREDGTGESPGEARRPKEVDVSDLFGEYDDRPAGRGSGRPSGGGGGARARADVQAVQTAPPVSAETAPAPPSEGAPEEPPRPQVKRSGAVSSLDEDLSGELGNGFSTLDGTDRWVGAEEGKPYACMFTRDEKVRSGQRISVRLLEDLVIGGVHIPRNTHLQGVVSISDRLGIAITSLDMGGRIITFHFEAYDTDGGKGIYCSDLGKVRKEATEQGLSTVSSSLNSRLGKVARDVASVGASIIRSKSGETTVKVPAGYTFYIIEESR